VRLDLFCNKHYERGASLLKEGLWVIVSGLLVETWLPGSRWRVFLLRCFGADVGFGVVVKPRLKIKFPWRLRVGDQSWLGEGVWIDNLEMVEIGNHVCISQGAYLCTGSHDWSSVSFDLIVSPITIASHAWICAYATLAPGTIVGEGAVVTMGENAAGFVPEWMILRCNTTIRRAIK
jgi:putative colanic acid biosynthesis acetyltransferase WcaF